MVSVITHEEILEAEPGDLQIIEVLSASEYQRMHLPRAVSIPLTELNRDAVDWLDRSKPVVVYCFDAY
jgi:rhodanese-related sulfurtransferase